MLLPQHDVVDVIVVDVVVVLVMWATCTVQV
jgi:hypothetical protein